jgi:UDP-MurNAc hydroxylase
MNTFKVITNATTIINDDLIIDPWIYGNVYYDAWSPYPDPKYSKKKLKKIKYCFISHIHPDHWDLETIKLFNKSVKFFIPDIIYNRLIERNLRKIGFKNFNYLKLGKFHKINKNYKFGVVPALNQDGQEKARRVEKDNPPGIDTGLIVQTQNDKKNHLILTDNTPYNHKIYNKHFGNIDITSCFFPYNGIDDYPLCYDNFSLKEKKRLSIKRCHNREKVLIKFFKKIKPQIIIPHSSDFTLNIRKKEFYKIHSGEFMEKDLYAKRIEKKSNIRCVALYEDDVLEYDGKNFNEKIKSNKKSRTRIRKNVKVILPKVEKKFKLHSLVKQSFESYLFRLKKYNFKIKNFSNWKLLINISKSKKFLIDPSKKEVKNINGKIKKHNLIILNTSENIFRCILERKLHLNNCLGAMILSWQRYPNKFNKDFNESLSFFHL